MTDHPWPNADIPLPEPLCIGIGGVSRAGKTFLANLLTASIRNSIAIHQDTYTVDIQHIPEINGHVDWEQPASIDWVAFRKAIDAGIRAGKTVVVEGLFAFHDPEICRLYDKSIFITLEQDEFFSRKQNDLRWGAEPDWYIRHIWESHLLYGRLPEHILHPLILDGSRDFELSVLSGFLSA